MFKFHTVNTPFFEKLIHVYLIDSLYKLEMKANTGSMRIFKQLLQSAGYKTPLKPRVKRLLKSAGYKTPLIRQEYNSLKPPVVGLLKSIAIRNLFSISYLSVPVIRLLKPPVIKLLKTAVYKEP